MADQRSPREVIADVLYANGINPDAQSRIRQDILDELGRAGYVIVARSDDKGSSILLAYHGKMGCTDVRCTRVGWRTDRCYGWHCGVCDEPSSSQGHPGCVGGT